MTTAVAPPPDDREIVTRLRRAFPGRHVVSVRRHPYRFTTSFRLEELHVALDDGSDLSLILKDLSWDRLRNDARRSKPRFLYEPRREVDAYRHLLGPNGIGVHCHVAVVDESGASPWLALEKAPGVELWQIGDMAVWDAVARWLAGFHARFADRLSVVQEANPYLLSYGIAWFRFWADRARASLEAAHDPRAPELLAALERYDRIVHVLAGLPSAFLHGEFYPSNVMVDGRGDDIRIAPVDWEMAAIGPGLLDLAALAGGWPEAQRMRLVSAYRVAMAEAGMAVPPLEELLGHVGRCRLHLALQWLGWADAWRPPAEHAQDWTGEALGLARELLR
jgi:hypothetical protein